MRKHSRVCGPADYFPKRPNPDSRQDRTQTPNGAKSKVPKGRFDVSPAVGLGTRTRNRKYSPNGTARKRTPNKLTNSMRTKFSSCHPVGQRQNFSKRYKVTCHCIGVFSDAVSLPFKEIIEEHCVTEDGHAVAQVFNRRPCFPRRNYGLIRKPSNKSFLHNVCISIASVQSGSYTLVGSRFFVQGIF